MTDEAWDAGFVQCLGRAPGRRPDRRRRRPRRADRRRDAADPAQRPPRADPLHPPRAPGRAALGTPVRHGRPRGRGRASTRARRPTTSRAAPWPSSASATATRRPARPSPPSRPTASSASPVPGLPTDPRPPSSHHRPSTPTRPRPAPSPPPRCGARRGRGDAPPVRSSDDEVHRRKGGVSDPPPRDPRGPAPSLPCDAMPAPFALADRDVRPSDGPRLSCFKSPGPVRSVDHPNRRRTKW